MERSGRNISNWIIGTTIVVAIYMVLVATPLDWAERAALFIGMVFPLVIISMAYLILRSKYDSKETFDDRFYEDGSLRSGNES